MNDTLTFLLSLIQHPQAPATVLGLFVPFLVQAIKEHLNYELSMRVKFFINVALCGAFAFIPLGIHWTMEGIPTADQFWDSLIGAATASSSMYHLFVKPKLLAEKHAIATS